MRLARVSLAAVLLASLWCLFGGELSTSFAQNASSSERDIARDKQVAEVEGDRETYSKLIELAFEEQENRNFAKSRGWFEIAIRFAIDEFGTDSLRAFSARRQLAELETDAENLKAAEGILVTLIRDQQEFYGDQYKYRKDSIRALRSLADIYDALGDGRKAKFYQLKTLEFTEEIIWRLGDSGSKEYRNSVRELEIPIRVELARKYYRDGDLLKAEEQIRGVLSIIEDVPGSLSYEDNDVLLLELSDVLIELGRYSAAKSILAAAMKRFNVEGLDARENVARARLQVGTLERVNGRYEMARAALEEALSISIEIDEPDLQLNVLEEQAVLYDQTGQISLALQACRFGAFLAESSLSKFHSQTARFKKCIAEQQINLGEPNAALETLADLFVQRNRSEVGTAFHNEVSTSVGLVAAAMARLNFDPELVVLLLKLDLAFALDSKEYDARAWRVGALVDIAESADEVEFAYVREATPSAGQNSYASWLRLDSDKFQTLKYALVKLGRYREAELLGRMSKSSDFSKTWQQSDDDYWAVPFTEIEYQWDERIDDILEQAGANGDKTFEAEALWGKIASVVVSDAGEANYADKGFLNLQAGVLEKISSLGSDVGLLQIAPFEESTHFFLLTPKERFQHYVSNTSEQELSDMVREVRDQLGRFERARSTRVAAPVSSPFEHVAEEDLQDTLKQLHDYLMPPEVEAMLEEAGIEHVVLNLQGQLRYVPFAALYDGDKYFFEKYELSRFSWGEFDYEETEGLLSSAVGFGMSEATEEFAALPGVKDELDAIFSENGDDGIFTGAPLVNEDFTLQSLEEALQNPPSIFHIASHFDMRTGSDAGNSFLLLGDGSRLTLNEFNASPKLSFQGVNLLVLSACSTARSTEGTGIEVEGLGAIAQLRGAEAVMATLWNVADPSTAEFIRTFYSELANPDINKAEALRNAQLSLLGSDEYSHPYYWAPYILMGNWK